MSNAKRSFVLKKDFIIIGALLLFAGGWLAFRNFLVKPASSVQADIYYDSRMVKTVALTSGLNETFAVPGQPDVVLRVSNGKICFDSSTCRDKICIKAGYLSRPGESAACLPNKVAVKLVAVGSSKQDGPDTYIS